MDTAGLKVMHCSERKKSGECDAKKTRCPHHERNFLISYPDCLKLVEAKKNILWAN